MPKIIVKITILFVGVFFFFVQKNDYIWPLNNLTELSMQATKLGTKR